MANTTFIRSTIFGLGLSLALIAACGGDTDVPPETGDESEDPSSAGSDDGGDTAQDGGSSDDGGGSSSQNACGADAVNMDDPCEVCIASQCTAEALACCQQPGCLDVVYCAAEHGCDGVDCYTPDKCQTEIDAAGVEVAMNEATDLGACAVESCATECGVDDLIEDGEGG